MLIFCGKQVGAELLKFLIGRGEKIEQIVASSDKDVDIIRTASKAEIPIAVYNEGTVAALTRKDKKYRWLLSLWNPHILPRRVLDLAEQKLNLHPSLLPYGRGSDSSAWAIREKSAAGVSLIDIVEGVDQGGIYAQRSVEYLFPTRGEELHIKLQAAMIALFKDEWPSICDGSKVPRAQPGGGSFHRRLDTNADRVKNEHQSMEIGEFVEWILAHDFYPGTTAEFKRDGRSYRLRISVDPID